MTDSPQETSRFELEFVGLARSIDEALLVAPSAVFWLVYAAGEKGFPPFNAPLADAIARFGSPPQAALDLWRACGVFDRQSRLWCGKSLDIPAYADVATEIRVARERTDADTARAEAPAAPDAPADELVGPDEAVDRPPADNGADQQQRLAVP